MNGHANLPSPTAHPSPAAHSNLMVHPNPMMFHGMRPEMLVWGHGFLIISLIISLVVLIDLILVGIWLWKQIRKK
jgi:hypothetical protein